MVVNYPYETQIVPDNTNANNAILRVRRVADGVLVFAEAMPVFLADYIVDAIILSERTKRATVILCGGK